MSVCSCALSNLTDLRPPPIASNPRHILNADVPLVVYNNRKSRTLNCMEEVRQVKEILFNQETLCFKKLQ